MDRKGTGRRLDVRYLQLAGNSEYLVFVVNFSSMQYADEIQLTHEKVGDK